MRVSFAQLSVATAECQPHKKRGRWVLVEIAQRFPRLGRRVVGVHGAGSVQGPPSPAVNEASLTRSLANPAPRAVAGQAALTFRLAHETDVDFSIDVPPFLSLSKRSNQLLKLLGMLGSVFKPRQKVEGFTNIAAMIKLPCDGR